MLRIWLQAFMIWIQGTQSIRYAVVSIHWRIYVTTSTKQFTQIYRKWQTPLRKRAWPCVIFHRKLNGHCCVCRTPPVRRHSILPRPTPTSGSTTFMGIMHCWQYAQHYYWYWCAPYAVYCAAFVANGPTATAMIAAIKELVHDFWFCKLFSAFSEWRKAILDTQFGGQMKNDNLFLCRAVTIIFLTTSILLAVGLVIFLSGLVLHRGACVPLKWVHIMQTHQTKTNSKLKLRNRCINSKWKNLFTHSNRSDDVFQQYIDKAIDLNSVIYANGHRKIRSPQTEPLKISQVIDSCHRNSSIYKVSSHSICIALILAIAFALIWPQIKSLSCHLIFLPFDSRTGAQFTKLFRYLWDFDISRPIWNQVSASRVGRQCTGATHRNPCWWCNYKACSIWSEKFWPR